MTCSTISYKEDHTCEYVGRSHPFQANHCQQPATTIFSTPWGNVYICDYHAGVLAVEHIDAHQGDGEVRG